MAYWDARQCNYWDISEPCKCSPLLQTSFQGESSEDALFFRLTSFSHFASPSLFLHPSASSLSPAFLHLYARVFLHSYVLLAALGTEEHHTWQVWKL